MDKSNIIKMKCEFPDAFFKLWKAEMLNCKNIVLQKARWNKICLREKKAEADAFDLSQS